MKFEILKSKTVPKKWGYEEIIINNIDFCSKILHYNRVGSISSFHLHPIKKELFKIINGSFEFSYKDDNGNTQIKILKIGDIVYIPNYEPHRLKSLEDNSEVLEISTNHNDCDIVRIEPGDNQK
jgi:mannose-6-phosphate isomerase-like protein (cupin superfamily)